MDDFPQEPPRFWIAVSIFVATLALIVFMLVYTTVRAEAQPLQCVRMENLIKGMTEVLHERKIWQGVKNTPQGPIETFLFQSQDGKTWTIVDVLGKDATGKPVVCFVAVGTNGVPNDLGRGV